MKTKDATAEKVDLATGMPFGIAMANYANQTMVESVLKEAILQNDV